MLRDNKLYVSYGEFPKEIIKDMLTEIKPFANLGLDKRIALKPNLVLPKISESGATTSPELVSGIIEHFQERGFKNLAIMESSWLGARTEESFDECGFTKLSRKYNVPLIDLEKDRIKKVTVEKQKIDVAESILEVEKLINIPVLKAHCQTQVTCSLKNLKGCIPDKEKRNFHTKGLDRSIAILNKVVPTDLVIVDGFIGDLTFEEGGNPVNMGRIIMGYDRVLVDSYCSHLLGYTSEDLPEHIIKASKLNLGDLYDNHKVFEKNAEDKKVIQSDELPMEFLEKYLKSYKACSPCEATVVHALMRLRDEGLLERLEKPILLGQGYQHLKEFYGIGIGKCASRASKHLPGCPPRTDLVVRYLKDQIENKN
ncbi:DUF362 domain-containing protein [Natranaerobius trueperi]|uniref:Iron-sulfur cluster-binding protein n=1 Tax=Natranaerobius trueperi TaxID=759412 RepID=A0A226C0G6_9FIRM|nr:DUF362 domain-containing protein [Natranaerobius trueperi]OWZ84726.1 iron-sulfur cluster-binding protein [Natranaerobius trueperi]